jgi:hypothetical protein
LHVRDFAGLMILEKYLLGPEKHGFVIVIEELFCFYSGQRMQQREWNVCQSLECLLRRNAISPFASGEGNPKRARERIVALLKAFRHNAPPQAPAKGKRGNRVRCPAFGVQPSRPSSFYRDFTIGTTFRGGLLIAAAIVEPIASTARRSGSASRWA